MSVLSVSIFQRATSLEEGGIVSPKEFLHLASRAAIDQAFTRLTKAGRLLRVGRGLYVAPVTSRFGTRSPAPEKVVAAVAHQKGEIALSHGAAAANALGLTTQVPVREVFLSSGPSRKLPLGKRIIDVRHAPRWQLILGTSRAGMAARALAWLGKEHLGEVLPKLREQLSAEDWEKLAAARASLPSLDGQGSRQCIGLCLKPIFPCRQKSVPRYWPSLLIAWIDPPTSLKRTFGWYGICRPYSTRQSARL